MGWEPPGATLMALAVECDEVVHGQRPQAPDLLERIAGVLGDEWEAELVRRVRQWTLADPSINGQR